jgi:hypothetical protein
LQVRGKQVASEVAQHASDHDDHCMRSGKSDCEPNHSPEIVLDRNPECSNGRQVVGTDPVYQSGDEDGQQKQHKINLDFTSKITSTL